MTDDRQVLFVFGFLGVFCKYIATGYVKSHDIHDQNSVIVNNVLVQRKRTYFLDRIQGRFFQIGRTMLEPEG